MKEKRYIFIFILFLTLPQLLYGQQEITVKVTDEEGRPMSGVDISIEGSKKIKSGPDGSFQYRFTKPIVMPIRLTAEKKGYKVEEYFFLEEQKELEVVMGKDIPNVSGSMDLILTDETNRPLNNLTIRIFNAPFTTDGLGQIQYKGALPKETDVVIKNFSIVNWKVEKKKIVIAVKKNIPVSPSVNSNSARQDSLLDTKIETSPGALISIRGSSYNQYKTEFEQMQKEVLEERRLLEEKGDHLRKEIEDITVRLRDDKSLTMDERHLLEKYLNHLEQLLEENKIAYVRSTEKSKQYLQKLRLIILSKDSINYIAKIKLQKAEKEKAVAEKKIKRNGIIFSVLAMSLLLLAFIFYMIAFRFKKQKNVLVKVNEDLKMVHHELEKNIAEVQGQKRIIEEQNAKLDAFVYKASHDIKGPLKSVIGLTKTGSKLVTDPVSLEFFDHILKSTTKLDNLVGDLLKLTKAQQAQLQKSEVQVLQIIQDGLASFENLESFKDLKIEVDVEPKLIHSTDEQLLYSIVQNFIENGIKYRDVSKPVANLFIRARKREERLELEFEDNGMGIDPIHHPKIFDMFYKINPDSEGTGLGLHIVKVNVEKLGGKVNLESAPGKGTTFTILIDELK